MRVMRVRMNSRYIDWSLFPSLAARFMGRTTKHKEMGTIVAQFISRFCTLSDDNLQTYNYEVDEKRVAQLLVIPQQLQQSQETPSPVTKTKVFGENSTVYKRASASQLTKGGKTRELVQTKRYVEEDPGFLFLGHGVLRPTQFVSLCVPACPRQHQRRFFHCPAGSMVNFVNRTAHESASAFFGRSG